MTAEKINKFLTQIFKGIHEKRLQSLSVLVSALIIVGKAGVAALGRGIISKVVPKHKIKRVDRFLSNKLVVTDDFSEGLLKAVIGVRKSVKIAIDWTKIGSWPLLVASVVIKKRGIPVYWSSCDYQYMYKSQNAFEESFLTRLRTMIPDGVDVTLLFDRGFRRVSLVRKLKELRFHFVIRCCGGTYISGEKYSGMLSDLPLQRGVIKDLGEVYATVDKPERVRVIALFHHKQKEAWYLFTDLSINGEEIVKYYGRRFTIEEIFRDQKSTRYGWHLKELKVTRSDRLQRMVLILVIAYFLVTVIGLAIAERGLEKSVQSEYS